MVQRPNIMKAHIAEIENSSKLHLEIQNALLNVCESKLHFTSNLRIFGLVTISVDGKNNDIVIKLSKEWMKDTTTSITPTIADTTFTPIAPAPKSQTKPPIDKLRRTTRERICASPSPRHEHRSKKARYRTRTAPELYRSSCGDKPIDDVDVDSAAREVSPFPSAFSTPRTANNRHRGTLSAPCYLADQPHQASARKRIIQSVGKRFHAIRQASRQSEVSCTPVSRYHNSRVPRRSIYQCFGITKNKKLTYSAEDKKDFEQGTFACTLQSLPRPTIEPPVDMLPPHDTHQLLRTQYFNSHYNKSTAPYIANVSLPDSPPTTEDERIADSAHSRLDSAHPDFAILAGTADLLLAAPPPLISPLSPVSRSNAPPLPVSTTTPSSRMTPPPPPYAPNSSVDGSRGILEATSAASVSFASPPYSHVARGLPSTPRVETASDCFYDADPTTTSTPDYDDGETEADRQSLFDASMRSVRSSMRELIGTGHALLPCDEETVLLESTSLNDCFVRTAASVGLTGTAPAPATGVDDPFKAMASLRFKSRLSFGAPRLTREDFKENDSGPTTTTASATSASVVGASTGGGGSSTRHPPAKPYSWTRHILQSFRHRRSGFDVAAESAGLPTTPGVVAAISKRRYRQSPASKSRRRNARKLGRAALSEFTSTDA